jgi:hypothetical protein
MNKLGIFVICITLLFIIAIPVSATTVAQLSWSKPMPGIQVKSVDTDETGSLVVAGLSNGSILAFDAAGLQKWIITTNASIKKLVSDKSGNTAWINTKNESGFITSAGVQTAFKNDSFRNTTDVSISQDGLYYSVSELSPGKLWVYGADGVVYASNQSYYFANWSLAQLDPVNEQYIIAANQSELKIQKWNVTSDIGWVETNPLNQTPNTSMKFNNSFGNRKTIDVSATGLQSFMIVTNGSNGLYNASRVFIPSTSYFISNLRLRYKSNNTDIPFNVTKLYGYGVEDATASPGVTTVGGTHTNMSSGTGSAVKNDWVYVTGGIQHNGYSYTASSLKTDGNTVTLLAEVATGITQGNARTMFYNGTYFFLAQARTSGGSMESTVYRSSDAITWSSIGTTGRSCQASAGVMWNGRMYLGGGAWSLPCRDMVSSIDGVTWVTNSSIGFFPNSTAGNGSAQAHQNSLVVFNNQLWAFDINEIYSSNDGNTWKLRKATSFNNSYGSLVATNGTIPALYIFGAASFPQEVYRSYDGTNWSLINDTAPGQGYSVSSSALRAISNETIISMGGHNGTAYKTEVFKYSGGFLVDYVTFNKTISGNQTIALYYNNSLASSANSIFTPNFTNLSPLSTPNWTDTEFNISPFKYLTYNASTVLVGVPQSISIPELGGWVGVGETSNVTHVQINAGGFGTTYSGASSAGSSNQISTGDGASYSTEGRGLLADIYDISGVRKGTYSTGGQVNSVDIAQKTGLFTVGGGDDGKVYIFSKDASSNWYVYFQGDSGSPITTTAMSYRGEAAVAGRTDGTFEYYDIQSASISGISVDGYFFKDGAAYKNQPVEIFISSSVPFNWSSQVTGVTDSTGKFSTTCEAGKYYNFTVNGGEGHTIYLASTGVTSVYVSVLTSQQPYSFDAQYNAANGGITSVYTTSTPTDTIQITVTDTNNGTTLATSSGTGNYVYTYPDPAGIASVQVTAWISRPGSAPFREIRTVVSPNRFNVVVPGDNTVKYALSTIGLMVMAGLFGYINARRGALLLVAVAGMLVLLDFLPKSLTMFVTIALAFAVLGLFGQRQSV